MHNNQIDVTHQLNWMRLYEIYFNAQDLSIETGN